MNNENLEKTRSRYHFLCVSYDLAQRKWNNAWIHLQSCKDVAFHHKQSPLRAELDDIIKKRYCNAVKEEGEKKDRLVSVKKELDAVFLEYSNAMDGLEFSVNE